jgi:hypothetical protein
MMLRRWIFICNAMPSVLMILPGRQLSDEGLNVLINRPDYLQAATVCSAPAGGALADKTP